MSERKAVNLNNLTPQQLASYDENNLSEELEFSGINNGNLIEPVPSYDAAPSEVLIQNQNNAWIVLGRDRPADITSGYGGRGFTTAGAIDIVVGRMASVEGGPDSNSIVANNFFTDAARIHISQQTDVDRNFGLVGDVQSVQRSAVGIKADAVRLVGREGVKIVTGKAKNIDGVGNDGEKNSQGGAIESIAGIQLIAGNDLEAEGLEPIVKAYALNDTLQQIVERIQDLSDIVNEMAKIQTQVNQSIATHTHAGVMPGPSLTAPSADLAVTIATKEASKMSSVHQNLFKHKMNLGTALVETRLSPTGKKWFGSRWNKTN
jgi:hypothetical protein